jgi:Carbonic anhydrase
MSAIDEALAANDRYASNFQLGHLAMPPAHKLAIVACMDARLTAEQMLGLKTGDAHIVRNAAGIVTEDALRDFQANCHPGFCVQRKDRQIDGSVRQACRRRLAEQRSGGIQSSPTTIKPVLFSAQFLPSHAGNLRLFKSNANA